MKFPLGLTDLTEDHFGEIYELGSGEGKQNNKKKRHYSFEKLCCCSHWKLRKKCGSRGLCLSLVCSDVRQAGAVLLANV